MKEEKPTERPACPVPNGTLLIIGGAEAKEKTDDEKLKPEDEGHLQILEEFLKMAPATEPIIEVITTAGNEDPEGSYKDYKKSFEKICPCKINHIHHDSRESIRLGDLKKRLQAAHGIFLAGGDQLKLTAVYGGTEFLKLIKDRYIYDRLLIAGTSAGAMALSTPMIYAGVGRDEMIAGNVKVTTGLEFLKDVCVDTHFVDRGRFVRMAQVIATNPACIGLGVEENTAVIVRNGIEAEVIGLGVVIVIDARFSYGSNVVHFNEKNLISIRGLQIEILSKGEKYTFPIMNQPHQ